jgi:outer membrane protein TolC
MGRKSNRTNGTLVPFGLTLLLALRGSGRTLTAAEVVLYAAPNSAADPAPLTKPALPSPNTLQFTAYPSLEQLDPPVETAVTQQAPRPLRASPSPAIGLAWATCPPDSPFATLSELAVDVLVREVLARNPSVAQMAAAWQAAQARYPQVTSLDDPMFAATLGPGTFAPDDPGVDFAWRLEISQKYPWPGKRSLRGESALAEARAAGNEVDDMRLQLAESAQTAFYDYYLVGRALEVNDANLHLLERFRKNAETRYENGLVPLQDVEQARVEIGREQQRRLTLRRMHEVAVARINTLMNLPPDASLPPPPQSVRVANGLPAANVLRQAALARRPDLQALSNRIAAEQAALALAHKEFYPDLEPFFMYDRFMGNNSQNKDLAAMLGLKLNLPVRLSKRRGAVAEAAARLDQRRAELAKQTNQVNFEVQQAYAQVQESERTVRIYEKTILSAAKKNVEAAESAYETAKIPFLSLIEAQRNRVMLQDRYYEAIADYYRRRATLERVTGGPLLPPGPTDGAPGPMAGVPCAPAASPAR